MVHVERSLEDFTVGHWVEKDDGTMYKISGKEERSYGGVILIEVPTEAGSGGHSLITRAIDISFFDNHFKLL